MVKICAFQMTTLRLSRRPVTRDALRGAAGLFHEERAGRRMDSPNP
jgi:hypothetical protein